jgi:hypothetical protein
MGRLFKADSTGIPQPPVVRPLSDYIVIEAQDPFSLSRLVTEKIAEGYTPQGGVAAITYERNDEQYFYYSQAMIK